MDITAESMQLLNQRILTEFQVGREAYQPQWQKLAFRSNSTGAFNVYGWFGANPKWREWVGHRIFQSLERHAHVIYNRDWETSIAIPRNDILDDNFGQYPQQANNVGQESEELWDELIAEAVLKGNTAEGYDGQNFFDTDHPNDLNKSSAGVYSNSLTGRPLTVDNLSYVRRHMATYKDEAGKFRKIRGTAVLVPPALEQAAREAVAANYPRSVVITNQAGTDNVGGGAVAMPNPNSGMDVVVLDALEEQPTVWYVLDTRRIKPFVLQVRQEPQMVARTQPWMDNVFHRKTFEWGADARGNAGYAFPFTAVRVNSV